MRLSLKLAGLTRVPEDSAIYVKGDRVKRVLFGIDAGVPELSMAKQLGYDAVIAHHPQGESAIVDYYQVFKRHIPQMTTAGVPREAAEAAVKTKLKALEVQSHMRNYAHAVDVARLLKIPYMNIHTPLDEIGRRIMNEQIHSRLEEHSTLRDVVSALDELPEFQHATTKIKIHIGNPETPAGSVVMSHGAGTNGGYEIAKAYFDHGIGTVVYIHISPTDLERLKAIRGGNLIVTGHVASDSVGINPFLHKLEENGLIVTTMGVVGD